MYNFLNSWLKSSFRGLTDRLDISTYTTPSTLKPLTSMVCVKIEGILFKNSEHQVAGTKVRSRQMSMLNH